MDSKNEFLKRLRATFRIEADEHIRAISNGLLELEKLQDMDKSLEVIENIFREVHSLKGAARSVNLTDIEFVCIPLEGAFSALKRKEIEFSPVLNQLFYMAVDTIGQIISSDDMEQTPENRSRAGELVRKLRDVPKGVVLPVKSEEPTPAPEIQVKDIEPAPQFEIPVTPNIQAEEKPIMVETVRIPTTRLDPLLLQAEEMTLVKIAVSQRVNELKLINQTLGAWKTELSQWVDTQSAEKAKQASGVKWTKERLNNVQNQVETVIKAFEQDQRMIKQMVDDHLEAMKQVMMLPVSTLVEVFPKLVRDLAYNQGKEVDLNIRGAEIEIDKRILDELKDPLIHIIRNCVDHGIRKPKEREKKNKPPRGTLTIKFSAKDSRQVEIIVSDDGEGIDIEKVRSVALKLGIISEESSNKLDLQETLTLIFQSGVSTSPIITDISGHGLGLAIVREKVEKLGGIVKVDTKTGVGTTYRLLLPMTLATFRGILVRIGEEKFVLPTIDVERTVRIKREEIETIENRDTIKLDGKILSLVKLGEALDLAIRNERFTDIKKAVPAGENYIHVVVLSVSDKRIAFEVDEILDEHQVLVKGLGMQLKRVRNISGATVLDTGKVVLVLNVHDLMKSAVRSIAVTRKTENVEIAQERVGNILVAEDSITSRTLLKNILETAGYNVSTAVDGMDAFTQARSGEFDLIVSDVDMPRMNGFELTTKIRGDKKLEEVPLILVTALESRDDRERGIEVGANAYIIKSSFDQSNLLEVVRKLL